VLSAAEIENYRRDGYVVVRGVLARGEVEALHREAAHLWRDADEDPDRLGVFWRKHETRGRVADRLDPVSTISELFAAVARDPRLTSLAADVLGAAGTFFKDKLIMKPPGAFGYALHHDYAYWADLGPSADELTTLFLALDPSDATSGGIELFPGLHLRSLPPHPDDPLDVDPTAVAGERSVIPMLAAGDALLFHPLVPHRSAPNRSDRPRRVYIVTYMHGRHAGRIDASDPARRKVVYRSLSRENV